MPEDEQEWMRIALHDLCQPLTALECRLYLGLGEPNEPALRLAMQEAMMQCERLIDGVRGMQIRLG